MVLNFHVNQSLLRFCTSLECYRRMMSVLDKIIEVIIKFLGIHSFVTLEKNSVLLP